MLVLAIAAVAGASAVLAWTIDRLRCRRRNERGECGACRISWGETSSGDPYLIHGRLVCENCADKAKRRLPWELGALAGWIALAMGLTLAEEGLALLVFIPAGMAVATLGAVQLMKLANRNAQRRIAAGEFAGLKALGTESNTDGEAVPTDGAVGTAPIVE
ncbi:MAG: hypothetical protein KJO06_02910 [Gemmatimonadetes bacterium]|nr:hypothetical protein [Gemmatimonadota bacterium]NNK48195.1 hypothetical protein [Gemmatimonadota bacterium]